MPLWPGGALVYLGEDHPRDRPSRLEHLTPTLKSSKVEVVTHYSSATVMLRESLRQGRSS